MLKPRSITAAVVLEADLQMRALGVRRAIRRLEQDEPELAGYLMETSTRLYARLTRRCLDQRSAAALNRQAMLMTLVCVEAIRRPV